MDTQFGDQAHCISLEPFVLNIRIYQVLRVPDTLTMDSKDLKILKHP